MRSKPHMIGTEARDLIEAQLLGGLPALLGMTPIRATPANTQNSRFFEKRKTVGVFDRTGPWHTLKPLPKVAPGSEGGKGRGYVSLTHLPFSGEGPVWAQSAFWSPFLILLCSCPNGKLANLIRYLDRAWMGLPPEVGGSFWLDNCKCPKIGPEVKNRFFHFAGAPNPQK